jgi:hypothetical protein
MWITKVVHNLRKSIRKFENVRIKNYYNGKCFSLQTAWSDFGDLGD